MAPPAGQIRPAKYLGAFVLIVAVLYALVFFTGNGSAIPKLGIDLQGGTRVTLTARAPDGKTPTDEALNQARTLIETRVNGLGVSGAEVVRDGSNLVITVPGSDSEGAKSLGQTAKLNFRKVIGAPLANQQAPSTETPPSTSGSPAPTSGSQAPTSGAGAPPSEGASAPSTTGQGRPAPAYQQQPSGDAAQPSQSGQPQQSGAPESGAPQSGAPQSDAPNPATDPSQVDCQAVFLGNYSEDTTKAITEARTCRQDPALTTLDASTVQQALAAFTCPTNDPLLGNDDPAQPLLTCDQDMVTKYVLGPVTPPADGSVPDSDYSMYSRLTGEDIDNAVSGTDPQGAGFVVSLTFKGSGGDKWGKFTSANVNQQVAVVLDSQVVSAPNINEPILGGSTQISGQFGQREADNLANVLKYGSLPLSFEASEAETVSATLGLASLEAGLIAGAVGLFLVFLYCVFYYRLLGLLTILSLVLSGVIVYAVMVLLGRVVGFTLDLAGIAGLIIAIGITADSFVVFFERLKDEMREGRSFRSAVPRAWVRSRRTILSADAVSFLCAMILYVIAVGQVKGFAFTLGVSTVLDLIVVFLVTHPLVAIISKSKTKFLNNPKVIGLGDVAHAAHLKAPKSTGTAVKEA
ncbi:protein translocase subunit SecD [Actinosynnema mirum]|uniref:Protein translocase subunit SecD n=1 Tax=Actinosynnema mirum (strain ATCC 29888 / DSM 43827 / JCM 3225 / NBRC 14064 / NCIMB 13271 / NRRL B-12336 / IMRU 3971 / 101) TaxID=446462 RepID=C6WCM7_ACTMD|nr:protein translocase subunit SecD [Actinosynnema mirum]ACU35644.1 protein-export membrane protein SecD [Actinosynnema mirum DSM 43827]